MSKETNKRITELIIKCVKEYTDEEIESGTPLVSSGIIQSMDFLEIILTLEENGFYMNVEFSLLDSIDDVLKYYDE